MCANKLNFVYSRMFIQVQWPAMPAMPFSTPHAAPQGPRANFLVCQGTRAFQSPSLCLCCVSSTDQERSSPWALLESSESSFKAQWTCHLFFETLLDPLHSINPALPLHLGKNGSSPEMPRCLYVPWLCIGPAVCVSPHRELPIQATASSSSNP